MTIPRVAAITFDCQVLTGAGLGEKRADHADDKTDQGQQQHDLGCIVQEKLYGTAEMTSLLQPEYGVSEIEGKRLQLFVNDKPDSQADQADAAGLSPMNIFCRVSLGDV